MIWRAHLMMMHTAQRPETKEREMPVWVWCSWCALVPGAACLVQCCSGWNSWKDPGLPLARTHASTLRPPPMAHALANLNQHEIALGGPSRPPKVMLPGQSQPARSGFVRASPSPIQACVEPACLEPASCGPSAQCALCVASLLCPMRAFGVQDCPPQRLVRKTPRYYRSIRRYHRRHRQPAHPSTRSHPIARATCIALPLRRRSFL